MKKKNKYIYYSKCCDEEVIVDGDMVEGTMYWRCTYCGKPCDIEGAKKTSKSKVKHQCDYSVVNTLTNKIHCSSCGKAQKKEKICKLSNVYKLLLNRPFCKCATENPDIYNAYCLRIIETLED